MQEHEALLVTDVVSHADLPSGHALPPPPRGDCRERGAGDRWVLVAVGRLRGCGSGATAASCGVQRT